MKKKIVIFIPSLEYGGAERVTTCLAEEFLNLYDVYILTFAIGKNEYIINAEIKRININGDFISKILKVRKLVKEINPVFTITMMAPMYILVYFSLFKSGVVQIASERNDPKRFSGKKLTKILYQYLIKKADGIVFQTHEARDYYFNLLDDKSIIIKNPIAEKSIPSRWMSSREKVIVNVGRLHDQKNQIQLIRVFFKVHQSYPEYKLKIFGEGNKRRELEDMISKLNANDFIELMGERKGLLENIYKARMFVMTSNYEGMPNALIEAMSIGLPVISTDCPCGGPRELIKNYENGILVEQQNDEELEEKILELLSDECLCKRLSERAVNLKDELNVKKICAEWNDFCLRISEKI